MEKINHMENSICTSNQLEANQNQSGQINQFATKSEEPITVYT